MAVCMGQLPHTRLQTFRRREFRGFENKGAKGTGISGFKVGRNDIGGDTWNISKSHRRSRRHRARAERARVQAIYVGHGDREYRFVSFQIRQRGAFRSFLDTLNMERPSAFG